MLARNPAHSTEGKEAPPLRDFKSFLNKLKFLYYIYRADFHDTRYLLAFVLCLNFNKYFKALFFSL